MKRLYQIKNLLRPLLSLLIIFLAGTGSACRADADEARLYFTGDIIMHRPVKGSAQLHEIRDPVTRESLNNGGYDFLFSRIRSRLCDGDLVLGNMEFPSMPPYTSEQFVFNCPPVVLSAMKKAGFTAVTIANNHIMDQGPEGVRNTIDELDRNSIIRVGAGKSEADARGGRIVTIRDMRIGITACTDLINKEVPRGSNGFFINRFFDPKFTDDVRSLKSRCDYCIVVVHAGDEYRAEPGPKETAVFRAIADAGADLVIGHHPHILQRTEEIKRPDGTRSLIFYSLGNFISNQSGSGTRESAIVRLFLSRKKENIASRIELLPVLTSNTWDSSAGKHRIQTIAIDDMYRDTAGEMKADAAPAAAQRIKQRTENLKTQVDNIKKTLLPVPVEGVVFMEPAGAQ